MGNRREMAGQNGRVSELVDRLQHGLIARKPRAGQFIQALLEVIAELVGNLFALPARQAEAAGEKFEVKFEFLFRHCWPRILLGARRLD
jgi:hypothetical protein